MTVSTTISRVSYIEDGASIAFPVPFRFLASADLVVERLLADGSIDLLIPTTHYTVAGVDAALGGTVTRTAATTGATLRIRRRTARLQPTDYLTGDKFPAESHERALDRGIMINQEAADELDALSQRAIRLPDGEIQPPLPGSTDRAGLVLMFDEDGVPIAGEGTPGPPGEELGLIKAQTFASPAIILPAGTSMADIRGHLLPGDRYERAAYRKVSLEPSHPGKVQIAGAWFELIEDYACPDKFYRTGDTNDGASFLRARDFTLRKIGPVQLQLQPRVYDCDGTVLDFGGIAAQIIGSGFNESGDVGGFNANYNAFLEPARGSWIRAGLTSGPALRFHGGNCRGAIIDRVGFVQSHSTPAPGWAPTPYDYLIESQDDYGGLVIGDVRLIGINRAINCDNSGRLTIDKLRGQVFTEGVTIDHAYDKCFINYIDLWTYSAVNVNVLAYQQANLKTLRLGRVDGLHANYIFDITGFRGVSFEGGLGKVGIPNPLNGSVNRRAPAYAPGGGLNPPGTPAYDARGQVLAGGQANDVHIVNLYADLTKLAVYVDCADVDASFGRLTSQCYDITGLVSGSGAISGSAAIKLTGNAANGFIRIDTLKCERMSRVIDNASNCTISITHPVLARYVSNASKLFSSTGGAPVGLVRGPIWDQTVSAGTYGVDYVVLDDQLIYEYETTLSGSAQLMIAHNLGANASSNIKDIAFIAKGNSGEAIPVNISAVDDTYVFGSTSSIYAGRTVRGQIRMRRFRLPAW